MTQSQLNHAVAHATGEPVGTIRQMGFSVADPGDVCFDPEPSLPGDIREIQKRILACDLVERRRNVAAVPQRSHRSPARRR